MCFHRERERERGIFWLISKNYEFMIIIINYKLVSFRCSEEEEEEEEEEKKKKKKRRKKRHRHRHGDRTEAVRARGTVRRAREVRPRPSCRRDHRACHVPSLPVRLRRDPCHASHSRG